MWAKLKQAIVPSAAVAAPQPTASSTEQDIHSRPSPSPQPVAPPSPASHREMDVDAQGTLAAAPELRKTLEDVAKAALAVSNGSAALNRQDEGKVDSKEVEMQQDQHGNALGFASEGGTGPETGEKGDILVTGASGGCGGLPLQPLQKGETKVVTKSAGKSTQSSTSISTTEPQKKRANTTAASSSPKKRVRSMSEPEKEVDAAQEQGKPVTMAIARMLASDTQSRSFGRLRITEDQQPIRKGDVVTVYEPGWLAVVDDVRALHSDLLPIIDDTTGQPKLTKSGDTRIDHAWLSQCETMGPNEKVKTDHRHVYIFDDAYPAASPSASPSASKRSPHPLSPYSTPHLATLCPSPYAFPSFSYASLPCKAGSNLALLHLLPDYYFAVYALRDRVRSGAVEGEKGDGSRGVAYIRIGFSFDKQERRAEDEEGHGEQGGRKMGKGKGKGGKARKKVWPLTFNLHSIPPGRPYDPRSPQHFSRASQTWYDVADLQGGHHFRPFFNDGTDAQELTKSEEAGAMVTQKNIKGKDKGKGKSRASASLAPEQTTSTAYGTAPVSSAVSSRPFNRLEVSIDSDTPSRSSTTPPLSRSNPGALQFDKLVAALQNLSQSPIIRGGAYGLTGNAYLVTRASELVAILAASASPASTSAPSSASSSAAAAANAAAESRELLKSAATWEQEVDDRENGVGDGKGLNRAWRERGRAPVGCRWVCPESGEFI
ncbi:hypothetical protein JCM21900_004611 [Sporobolomyces salmonicolor]